MINSYEEYKEMLEIIVLLEILFLGKTTIYLDKRKEDFFKSLEQRILILKKAVAEYKEQNNDL